MQIKTLKITNFLGIDEFGMDASKINLIEGPKGSSKSSIIEAIEKGFSNKNRRTEIIKHGEKEATIFIETDTGLEIDRRIRDSKGDYLKCRKENEGVPSTEAFLKSLFNGDVFRPLDWVNMSIEQQTKSILSMLNIDWSQENIENWFGEIPSNIDFNQHILQILKAIENKYFKDREEVNRRIKELKTQIKVILDELPAEYDGEKWRNEALKDYYDKVTEAQKINGFIEQAKTLQANFEDKVAAIKGNAESDKARIDANYRSQREDIKDLITLSISKIEKAKDVISNVGQEQDNIRRKLELEEAEEIQKIKDKYRILVVEKVKEVETQAEEQKELINIHENKITQNNEKLNSLDKLQEEEIKAVDIKVEAEIDKEKVRIGKAAEYLENNEPINIEPLQNKADEVAEMQSYLRQWDMVASIRDTKLSIEEAKSSDLTTKITKVRELPSDLLKTAKMPVQGISVDSDGLIRINGTLIDGLSDGEKLELAMTIAKAQAGELKVICLDKFESLNPAAQKGLLDKIKDDEFQYFITSTMSDEFKITKMDGDK